jgi:hypothetical protein
LTPISLCDMPTRPSLASPPLAPLLPCENYLERRPEFDQGLTTYYILQNPRISSQSHPRPLISLKHVSTPSWCRGRGCATATDLQLTHISTSTSPCPTGSLVQQSDTLVLACPRAFGGYNLASRSHETSLDLRPLRWCLHCVLSCPGLVPTRRNRYKAKPRMPLIEASWQLSLRHTGQ